MIQSANSNEPPPYQDGIRPTYHRLRARMISPTASTEV